MKIIYKTFQPTFQKKIPQEPDRRYKTRLFLVIIILYLKKYN